jgi:hypothetical protein
MGLEAQAVSSAILETRIFSVNETSMATRFFARGSRMCTHAPSVKGRGDFIPGPTTTHALLLCGGLSERQRHI